MSHEEIKARYQRALDAKPSKGDYTPAGIDAITDSVCDIPDLLAEVDRLTRRTCPRCGASPIKHRCGRRRCLVCGQPWREGLTAILRALDGGES